MAVWNVIEEDELTSDTGLWSSGTVSTAYDHLCSKMIGKSTGTGAYSTSMTFQFNGDTGANYSMRDMQSSSAIVGVYNNDNYTFGGWPVMPSSATPENDNMFGSMTWWIPNYTASTRKIILINSFAPKSTGDPVSTGEFAIKMAAHSWNNSAALTSFVFDMNGPYNFLEKSSYVVYGINGA